MNLEFGFCAQGILSSLEFILLNIRQSKGFLVFMICCVQVWICMHVCVYARECAICDMHWCPQKLLELELQAMVSHPVWLPKNQTLCPQQEQFMAEPAVRPLNKVWLLGFQCCFFCVKCLMCPETFAVSVVEGLSDYRSVTLLDLPGQHYFFEDADKGYLQRQGKALRFAV